jgi:O-antigen ligase
MASSRVKDLPRFSAAQGIILLVILLALALGGATRLWEQGLVVMIAAGLILFAPPHRSLGLLPNLLFPALFLLSLAAFLPAAWSPSLPWRRYLTSDLQLALPATRTPQPWITAQACCLLFVSLVWAYYVLGQRWTSETRLNAARVLIFGVAVLAALAVAAFCFDFHLPNWDQQENRGWFPNRNQTADVLALCAVVNYALIFDCLRKKRPSLYLWLFTLAALAAALVVSYSRAGILMFFGGIALWHLWPIQHQKRRYANKWTALGLSLVFILLTCFFLFGGDTLERFIGARPSSADDSSFRLAIQKDALHFSLQSPWFGVGLGNFEPLFASVREASVNGDRAVHPESDWLWAACELGWFAPLLFIAGIVWWLRECLPFRSKSGESLRRAFVTAGILFIVHGFVDVSAHRVGSFFVGLMVFSLALPSVEDPPRWRFGGGVFRVLALGMLLVAGWWLASVQGASVPPTTANLDELEGQMDDALAHTQLAEMERLATAALQISPLDWHLYFQRAYAETFQPGGLGRAGPDFLLARKLELKMVKPCFDEGVIWLAAGQPDLCFDAWEEALRRANPNDRLDLYRDMSSRAQANDLVHDDLLQYASGKVDYELIFLGDASPDETKKIVSALLAQDPDLRGLDEERRENLFDSWWRQGDRDQLVAALAAHPDWLKAGWFFLAQSDAEQKNYQAAWEIVARCAPAPIVPVASSDRSLEELQTAFYDQTDNLAAGILLYLAQNKAGRLDDALATLRAVEQNKNCPKYVYYLEAQLWAAKQQWELAWTAWSNYHAT